MSTENPSVHSTALELAKSTDSRAERWAFLLLASIEESADRRLKRWEARESERQRAARARWFDGFTDMFVKFQEDATRRKEIRAAKEAMVRMQSQAS